MCSALTSIPTNQTPTSLTRSLTNASNTSTYERPHQRSGTLRGRMEQQMDAIAESLISGTLSTDGGFITESDDGLRRCGNLPRTLDGGQASPSPNGLTIATSYDTIFPIY